MLDGVESILNIRVSSYACEIRFLTFSSHRQAPDPTHPDEELTIRCHDGAKTRDFIITRSNLARSPVFQKFFQSDHFAPHCDLLIAFRLDPAAVFDIVKHYLEQGPELFDTTILNVYVHTRYRTMDQIILLVRLCRMAHNMGLWCLHNMAYNLLVNSNRLIDASILPILAKLIFATGANYHQSVRAWCLSHARHHFLQLKDSKDWARSLLLTGGSLRAEWQIMTAQHAEEVAALEAVPDDGEHESPYVFPGA